VNVALDEGVARTDEQELATMPSLAEKVAFLSHVDAYSFQPADVVARETHMSWVFLAGSHVFKLKKPVRFPYLDFSTLERRAAACRAELTLNRRLAPDVYEAVVPLVRRGGRLAIGGEGAVVDWLVAMHRLDDSQTLEHALVARQVSAAKLGALIATLVSFYNRAGALLVSPQAHLRDWRRSLAYNRRVLLDPRLGLPAGLVRALDHAQQQFLDRKGSLIARRVRGRHIVNGHGDLRPEHIFLTDPVRIIDCLEFNASLRAVDPFDEIAFLCLECERLGAGWASDLIRRRVESGLRDGLSEELFVFYRCHRATLRARLSIAHLLEDNPRTPEKWPRLARTYLDFAARDAARLRALIRRRGGRRAVALPAGG
jgi:aminoglycoside phosphotransferase family enzyme